MLQRYWTSGSSHVGTDPRKHSNPRRPLRTDASTGFGYFHGDKGSKVLYQTADLNDRSMTTTQRTRLIKGGCVYGPAKEAPVVPDEGAHPEKS